MFEILFLLPLSNYWLNSYFKLWWTMKFYPLGLGQIRPDLLKEGPSILNKTFLFFSPFFTALPFCKMQSQWIWYHQVKGFHWYLFFYRGFPSTKDYIPWNEILAVVWSSYGHFCITLSHSNVPELLFGGLSCIQGIFISLEFCSCEANG